MTSRLALALLVLSSSLASAQRVSFPPFTGKNGPAVRNQLVSTVCDTLDCVPASQTTTRNKPDWKKARKASVQSFITGNVTRSGLELAIVRAPGKVKSKKTFPLDKAGTLSAKNLQAAMEMLGVTLETATDNDTPPIEPAPKPTAKATPVERDDEPPPAPVKVTKPQEPPPEKKDEPDDKPKFLVLEAGVDIVNRSLGYSQVATGNLREYNFAAYAAVKLGAEFYPLALAGRDDLLSGLGVEVNVSFAPWLQSELRSVAEKFPTSAFRLDGGVRWNIVPVKSFPFAVTPYVGVRNQSFTVSPLADGRRLDGLPNVSFLGLRAGLGVEVPIVKIFAVFGRFGVVPTFSSGEIISPSFFTDGSTFGIEANAGVALRIAIVELRASFDFSNWGMTFVTQPTDRYVAAGANDRYLGGNVALRLNF